MADLNAKQSPDLESTEKVNMVIPIANHNLPSDAERLPYSLLDRWRSGGGIWLALTSNVEKMMNLSSIGTKLWSSLFRGRKRRKKTHALMMSAMEKREYAVSFDAKLSSIQAFSICVAMLHGSEAASAIGDCISKKKPMLPHCNSLKVLIEEEVKFLIDTVTKEEKKKPCKKLGKKHQYYKLRPPTSQFARV